MVRRNKILLIILAIFIALIAFLSFGFQTSNFNDLIQKKFNTELAHDLGLSGTQKIYVAFKIDKNGMVTDVRARAPHNQLEKEALRLTTKIPKMTPGKQRNIPVDVLYNLPIVFQVQ